jgi:hypothetical protein
MNSSVSLGLYPERPNRKLSAKVDRSQKNLLKSLERDARPTCKKKWPRTSYKQKLCVENIVNSIKFDNLVYWNQYKSYLKGTRKDVTVNQHAEVVAIGSADLGILFLKSQAGSKFKLEATVNSTIAHQSVSQVEERRGWGARMEVKQAARLKKSFSKLNKGSILYGDKEQFFIDYKDEQVQAWYCDGIKTEEGKKELKDNWSLFYQTKMYTRLQPKCTDGVEENLGGFCTSVKNLSLECSVKACEITQSMLKNYLDLCGVDENWQTGLTYKLRDMVPDKWKESKYSSRRSSGSQARIDSAYAYVKDFHDLAGDSWHETATAIIHEKESLFAEQAFQHYISTNSLYKANKVFEDKKQFIEPKTKKKFSATLEKKFVNKFNDLMKENNFEAAGVMIERATFSEKWQKKYLKILNNNKENAIIKEYKTCFSTCQSRTQKMGYTSKRVRYICTTNCESIMNKSD